MVNELGLPLKVRLPLGQAQDGRVAPRMLDALQAVLADVAQNANHICTLIQAKSGETLAPSKSSRMVQAQFDRTSTDTETTSSASSGGT